MIPVYGTCAIFDRIKSTFAICFKRMESGTSAFNLTMSLLALVIGLTGIGVFFSFGPGSQKLIDPWDHDDDD